MFNVLTEDLREDLKKKYKSRFLTLLFSICNFILLVVLASLIPSYFILKAEKVNLQIQVEELDKNEILDNVLNIKKVFKETNNYLNFLSANTDKPYIYDFVADISNIKNPSIQIKDIMFNRINATSSIVSIQGVALNREALVSFVKNIENQKKLKIDVPVSNFAKDKNIDFSFDIKTNI